MIDIRVTRKHSFTVEPGVYSTIKQFIIVEEVICVGEEGSRHEYFFTGSTPKDGYQKVGPYMTMVSAVEAACRKLKGE